MRKTLGLVGFHVVHKTKNRPQWIWTLFEHNDNVPDKVRSTTSKGSDPNKTSPSTISTISRAAMPIARSTKRRRGLGTPSTITN